MDWVVAIIGLVAGVSLGIGIAWLRGRGETSEGMLRDAERALERAESEAKRQAITYREAEETALEVRRIEFQATEDRLAQREATLEQRTANLAQREQNVQAREEEATSARAEAERLTEQARMELEQVAQFDSQAAKAALLERVEDEARREAMVVVRELELKAREEADRRGRRILTSAIQRLAADVTSDSTVSVVPLPSDDMKGRIIGRDGRNIKAFEAVAGVDLVVDDTPEAVTISTFDPVRREIARVALQNLVVDGRIHPASIEEAYTKAQSEVEESVRDAGEWALLDVGVSRMHVELVTLMGRLKYRTSYGQNVLGHCVEAAHIAGMLASELGIDPTEAKRAALLHDIGKAVSHEVGGSHALVGAEIARRFDEDPAVVHAIEAHHNEVEPRTLLAVLTQAADAVSASRPGARRETLESYVRRLERIEEMAADFEGVDRVFAMQAGRDVRVVVDPGKVSDLEAGDLARRIAKRIESGLQYPGQIQVTVIRELRSSAFAR
ncbi:MAG: ribonuclease Y [Acidimicrobiia bacterium]|nr:ribonuclease Y [Acidimicrobiia bacterium]MBT8193487.1 ribonuclease Y [Acidimicrobiia bacterium]NNF87930.1 ribonuclease Y [Acidimicrobiia bacterium]NNL14317.1 ribonuclease Y [Acidimicrobiia bacterium]RZV43203.1 MAG: ribonuclease Y [Acidimicrobiia bacterium]